MTKFRIMTATLLLCYAAGARQECAPTCDWKFLEGQKSCLGLSEARLGTMLDQCRCSGLTAKEADALLAPVYAARAEALPAEAVFTKIEEGLAKKVAVDRVAAAADLRLGYLRRATELADAQGWCEGRGGGHRLVVRVALVLESGLPEEVLQAVLNRHDGRRYGRLVYVLEAGETLQLAGLAPKDTQQIMMDCLDQDLNRMEVLRAVDYILSEKKKGRDFKSIYPDLWVGSD